jgi:hypothetical protein
MDKLRSIAWPHEGENNLRQVVDLEPQGKPLKAAAFFYFIRGPGNRSMWMELARSDWQVFRLIQ